MQRPVSIVVNDRHGKKIDFTAPSSRRRQRLLDESTWELPEHLGAGRFQKTELGNGLWIGIGEIRLKSRLWEKVCDDVPGVTFISCLKGRLQNRNDCFQNGFELSAGSGALCFSPEPVVIREVDPGDVLQKVIIKIPLNQTERLLENRQLERAVRNGRPFLADRPLCAGMLATLFQVFGCPFQGSSRRLYLEGKALELMAHWLQSCTKTGPSPPPLKPDEIERIWHAHDLLLADLCNPPSLMALSKAVGITHTRLNNGFKTLFGHTVFDWLRIQRMQKARLLVLEGRKNMTEIAYEIGFASSSHFTFAFRRFFGAPPSRYRS